MRITFNKNVVQVDLWGSLYIILYYFCNSSIFKVIFFHFICQIVSILCFKFFIPAFLFTFDSVAISLLKQLFLTQTTLLFW